MTTPTLPLPAGVSISPGSSQEVTARVLKAQFGNGYAQRMGDGLNAVTAEYQVSFDSLTKAEAQAMNAFFRERAGWQAFYFTPPGESVARMWTCEKWRIANADAIYDTVSATFSEVFAP